MNTEDYVTYEFALMLKKAGFDWPCKYYYTKENAKDKNVWLTFTLGAAEDFNRENKIRRSLGICSAPTLAQAQKWLRAVKSVIVIAIPKETRLGDEKDCFADLWYCDIYINESLRKSTCGSYLYPTYESALSAGIEAALKLIEEGEG